MVEKAGQVYRILCNETALLSELKALLASTSNVTKNSSHAMDCSLNFKGLASTKLQITSST